MPVSPIQGSPSARKALVGSWAALKGAGVVHVGLTAALLNASACNLGTWAACSGSISAVLEETMAAFASSSNSWESQMLSTPTQEQHLRSRRTYHKVPVHWFQTLGCMPSDRCWHSAGLPITLHSANHSSALGALCLVAWLSAIFQGSTGLRD